ncbi:Pimeloyl-ACP methyl ester carboxylesterase [Paraoerskovia marina]|uniref:Pimeloyl-ACP methyl ester carboxylesterase n=1 Tax=Paraoerskovia marina TaxID=545619 RepID=A0A1H1PRF4_9CELL|nr:alpha/beta hydrolase [Paraoerskovia marina]SDS13676.1 Pimeloyl-ACP methyl ester carboxylesterase [Paraoerskovia marina]
MIADYTVALQPGPWRHEMVPANGSRFHVALADPPCPAGVARTRNDSPLVLLLHGFAQTWWAWRHQIPALCEAGYRVAAMDLRGTGGSDKPPLGYDAPARTRDVAGVVRALGADRAVVIGHGSGGALAWGTAALQPAVVAGVGCVASPHPARLNVPLRKALTPVALRRLAFAQVPTLPERGLVSGELVDEYLAEASVVPLAHDVVTAYQAALRIPFTAHSTMEAVRWTVRSAGRPSGRRYLAALRRPVTVPALQVHGERDPYLRRSTVDTDAAAIARHLRFESLDGVGHLVPEEAPERVSSLLVDWLDETQERRSTTS